MYEVMVTTHFSAAHRLVDYPGACAALHGHNWEVRISLQGARLNKLGILVDFRHVKDAAHAVLESLDHADLNALPAFARQNPTSENIACHLFKELSRRLNDGNCRIARVAVCETPGSMATYWEPARKAAGKGRKPQADD